MSIKSQRCITTVMEYADMFLGVDYSRGSARNNIWPGEDEGGSADCSSLTAAIWAAAGFPLLDASGNELRTSCYEVNAVGFDLVYPQSRALIGKNLPSPKGLLSTYGAQPGDVVFWNFDADTERSNKITHVGNIYQDGAKIVHTANNKNKCCYVPLSYGDRKICAIIRLQEDFVYPALPAIGRPSESSSRPEEWQVRMLQVALNIHRGTKLVCDGQFGKKTEAAVIALNAEIGKPGKICTADTWAALGFPNAGEPSEQLPQPDPGPTDWPVKLQLTTPYMRPEGLALLQDGLNRMGYGCGTADGIYGDKSRAGVQAFAQAHINS